MPPDFRAALGASRANPLLLDFVSYREFDGEDDADFHHRSRSLDTVRSRAASPRSVRSCLQFGNVRPKNGPEMEFSMIAAELLSPGTTRLRKLYRALAMAGLLFLSPVPPAQADPGDRDPGFDGQLTHGERLVDGVVANDGSVYLLTDVFHAKPTTPMVIRLLPDGRKDPDYHAPTHLPDYKPSAVRVDADGALYWSAWSGPKSPAEDRGLLHRLRADGVPDPGFDTRGRFTSIEGFLLHERGDIWVQGVLTGREGKSLVRLDANGEVKARILDFAEGAWCGFKAMVLRPGGRVLVAGQLRCRELPWRGGVAQFLEDGRLDPDFLPDRSLTLQKQIPNFWCAAGGTDGEVWIGGLFLQVAQHPSYCVAKLLGNAAVDTSFRVRAIDGDVDQVWPCSDGSVLIAGRFGHIDGMRRDGLARLRMDGSLDTGFVTDLPGDRIRIVGIRKNGDVLVAGQSYVALLPSEGTRMPAWHRAS